MTDDLLKVIVNYLKYDADIWDNTILIVASDNGAKMGYGDNSPLRGSKFTLWEGGVRVPAFITGGFIPDSLKGSALSNVAVHAIDWYPTLLTAAGIKRQSSNQLDGMDLWNFLMTGGNSEPVLLNENARKHIIGEEAIVSEDMTLQNKKKVEAIQLAQYTNQGFKVLEEREEEEEKEKVVVAVFSNEELNAIANDRYILLNVNNGDCDISYGVCGAILYKNRWKLVIGANGLVSSEYGSPQSDTCFWNRDFLISTSSDSNNANDAIDCGDYPYNADTHSCDCSDFPCLFDLENDPCEYNDVYDDYSEIGDKLASKLKYYYSNEQVLSLWTSMDRISSDVITQINENQDYWQPWYEKLFDYSGWQDIEFEQKLAKYRVTTDNTNHDHDSSTHKDNINLKYDADNVKITHRYRWRSSGIDDSLWYDGVYGVAVIKGVAMIALVVAFVMAVSGGLIILYNRFGHSKKNEISTRVDDSDEPDIYSYNAIEERGTTLYGSMNNSMHNCERIAE